MMNNLAAEQISTSDQTETPGKDWFRLPGLFRRWELTDIVEPGENYFFEPAGASDAGVSLFAVYQLERNPEMGTP